jgi:ATP-dependent protease HslVU (ClpYQ) peptidase subunit
MTTIVATTSPSYAAILSESQVSEDATYLRIQTDCIKVVSNGSWVISGAGIVRPADILNYIMKWPAMPQRIADKGAQVMAQYIIQRVIPKMIVLLEKHKAIDFDKGTASLGDAEFLIATHGHLFSIDESFGVTPIKDYFIGGSGGKIALGALHALRHEYPAKWNKDHADMGVKAIQAAIQFDLYSGGTIRGYRSLPNGSVKPIHV